MAVNELERDYLRLIHMADSINSIINGNRMTGSDDPEKKETVQNHFQYLEMEILDDKYDGKDLTAINAAITAGRAYVSG